MIHQQEKAALELKLAASLEREEQNKSEMQDLKGRLEKTEQFMRRMEAKGTTGETDMPDAKKRRGDATTSDSDKLPPTSEAKTAGAVDAEGDANMSSDQLQG